MIMNYLKKFGLLLTGVAFCLSLYVVSANAQRRDSGSWQHRQDGGYGQRINRRWRNRERRGYWEPNRYDRFSRFEYHRLQRLRARINRNFDRYDRDRYVSYRERRAFQRRAFNYRRNIYRARRNW